MKYNSWYSDDCYVCMETFSKKSPRVFLFDCKHCLCLSCSNSKFMKNKKECFCKSGINKDLKNSKNLILKKINNSFVLENDDESMNSNLLISSSVNKCCVIS